MAKSKKPEKPKPPYKGFPLSAHPAGVWCKRIKGKLYYFGGWSDPDAALKKYLRDRDNLQAGLVPRVVEPTTDTDQVGHTVEHLCNTFLDAKFSRVESNELSLRSFNVYKAACNDLAKRLGKHRLLSDILPEDFEKLRSDLAAGCGLVTLANKIRLVRIVLNYAYDQELIEKPFRLKTVFAFPSKTTLRSEKNTKPLRLFSADEIRSVLGIAGVQLRAMTLLGLNCGFGQNDISSLPLSAINLDAGRIDFPRPKTAVQRTCMLWPETVTALRAAFEKRPAASDPQFAGLAFITKYGKPFVRSSENGIQIDSIALEFGKLLTTIGLKAKKTKTTALKGKGLNFYALRHTFETVASETVDQIAVDFIMGHAPRSGDMAAIYRQLIREHRLSKVTDYVRQWLWPDGSEAAWLTAEAERLRLKAEADLRLTLAGKKPGRKSKPVAPVSPSPD